VRGKQVQGDLLKLQRRYGKKTIIKWKQYAILFKPDLALDKIKVEEMVA
jgi:hypothetical protein